MPIILGRQPGGAGGGGAPSGPAGGSLAGTYPDPSIAAGAVGSAEIAANAVGSSELADNAVDTNAIGDDQVTQAKIAPGAVGRTELATGIGVFDLLFDSTLGAAAAGIDSNPSVLTGYKHLLVLAILRMNAGTSVVTCRLRFNNDSGASYDASYVQVANTTVTGARDNAGSGIPVVGEAADAAANMFASSMIHVIDYASTTKFKPVQFLNTAYSDTAADTFSRNGGGQWRSTSAITRVALSGDGTDLAAGSRLTIYGQG